MSKPKRKIYKVKELFPNLFQLRIPLPIPTLNHLNAYLIRGGDQCLLIDTGMPSYNRFRELKRQMNEIEVKPENLTEILGTHFHIDHVGLVPRLRDLSKAQLLISAKTSEALQMMKEERENHWKNIRNLHNVAGVPMTLVERMLEKTPGYMHQEIYENLASVRMSSRILVDGATVSIGDYSFKTIWTPGHAPGHICLYESKKRLLFVGDHLLPKITPHVAQLNEKGNALADYLGSLDKIEKLDVDVVLPGHEELFKNHRRRIKELLEHHRLRAMEILSEIQSQDLTAYQIASRIKWNAKYASWNRFPPFQKLLAVGEALAHLKLLEKQSQVRKNNTEPVSYRAN